MLRKPNAQGLLDLIRANEEAEGFNLRDWLSGRSDSHPCGTHGCLAGNYALRHGLKSVGLGANEVIGRITFHGMAVEFDLSIGESQYLFSPFQLDRTTRGFVRAGSSALCLRYQEGSNRSFIDREAAINCVRKFLYYKLRKWELLYEEDGRVRESARRTEGDHHVCRSVLRECVAV